jgi:hypothetical protein
MSPLEGQLLMQSRRVAISGHYNLRGEFIEVDVALEDVGQLSGLVI